MKLPLQLKQPDADRMVSEAVQYAANKKFSGDASAVLNALQSGRCDICRLVSDSLVNQISQHLSAFDKKVKSIYRYEPEQISMGASKTGRFSSNCRSGINLVAWVEQKSAALNALIVALEDLLTEARKKINCSNASQPCFVLDIHLVDDNDVEGSRGLGLLVHNHFLRSIPVWNRQEEGAMLSTLSGRDSQQILSTFDPELTPIDVLFAQARDIQNLPENERQYFDHHLQEIKVVLIRRMISDQLAYINIAKKWLTIDDLLDIRRHMIGQGKIGGKAAGMLLSARILQEKLSPEIRERIRYPQSYFIGADVDYIFLAMNGLMHWSDQKYKSDDRIWADYEQIVEEFRAGEFPPEVSRELEEVLEKTGKKPLIVRSSSQLEDNFGTAFAGKYESYFLGNQGSREENLEELKEAIARIYASVFKPDALLYRKSKGLQDYDERMAVLIQEVQGEIYDRYYLPYGAGVAFSRNLYRWAQQIRREDGFMRLVWGLGTRAVERVGDDFPRLVALSHPNLQPDDSPQAVTYYSQRLVDVIDLQENRKTTLPVNEVLGRNYPAMQWLVEVEEEGYYRPLRQRLLSGEQKRMVVTFSELMRRTDLARDMRKILRKLEEEYETAVDVEFTLSVEVLPGGEARTLITLLQCRPQSHLVGEEAVYLPSEIPAEDIVFSTEYMVPHGYVKGIEYVVYVPAKSYFGLSSVEERLRVGRLISQINRKMREKKFICVGPGRWGTTNHDLGVYVGYGDIDRAGALVEICGQEVGVAPEPSLGTHFFQDLMEGGVFPVALNLDEQEVAFNADTFTQPPNRLAEWVENTEGLQDVIRLIKVSDYRPDHRIDLVMDNEKGRAVAFLRKSNGKK